MVPANRYGYGYFNAAQLKTIQEVITLTIFMVFSVWYLGEPLRWNHALGFAFIVAGRLFRLPQVLTAREGRPMEYRRLGNSGAVVSSALPRNDDLRQRRPTRPPRTRILDAYAAAGGNFIDTADVYSAGASETIVGRWLAAHPPRRGRWWWRPRPAFPMGPGPNDLGTSRRHLGGALDASLGRLGVERIDLYQMHAWDALTPIEETLRFLDDATRAGKIAYYGFSNFLGWQVTKAVHVARALAARAAGDAAAAVQPPGARHRARDRAGLPRRRDRAPALVAARRRLARGKVRAATCRPTARPASARTPSAAWRPTRRATPSARTWRVIDAVAAVAAARGVSQAEVALAWVRARPAVTSVILGARTTEQLAENLKAADLVLDATETETLDAASAPEPGVYPYGPQAIAQRHRKIEGGR